MAATSEAKKSSPVTMPIEDFDRLSIKEILPLLKTLSSGDLKAVTVYEKAGKNRVTLLRGIRKIELAREADAPKKPAKGRLTVVDLDLDWAPDLEGEPVPAAVAPPVAAPVPASVVAPVAEPTPAKAKAKAKAKTRAVAKADAKAQAKAPVVPTEMKTPRARPVVKAATWEEEIQPQLPRRFQTSSPSWDLDFDAPAPVEPAEPMDLTAPSPTPIAKQAKPAKVGKAAPAVTGPSIPRSRPFQVVKKFENVALVMAAILAILLGLAIGTVLARTGGTDPTPPASASQASVVQTAG